MQNLHIPPQCLRRSLEHNRAFVHHVYAIRDAERERQILLDQQDRKAFAAQLFQDFADRFDDERRESFAGLVE